MVVHAGIFVHREQRSITTFNTVTKEFGRECNDDDNTVYGCCCICFKYGIIKENRKKENLNKEFIEKGFSKICFINERDNEYCHRMFETQFFPKFGDIIWILKNCANSLMKCDVYQKGYEKARYSDGGLFHKDNVNSKKFLLKRRDRMETKKDPSFIIFADPRILIDDDIIYETFPFCKFAKFNNNFNYVSGDLIKARIEAGEKELEDLDVEMNESYAMDFKIQEITIIQIHQETPFPFKKKLVIFNTKKQPINVCSQASSSNEIVAKFSTEENIFFTFSVDENGIYSGGTSHIPMSFLSFNNGSNELQFYDVSYLSETEEVDKASKNAVELRESEKVLCFMVNAVSKIEEFVWTLFVRKIVIKIDMKEITYVSELTGLVGKNNGYLLSHLKEKRFIDIAFIFENIDCCKSDEILAFIKEFFVHRKIVFGNFYTSSKEALIIETVKDASFSNDEIINRNSILITEETSQRFGCYSVPQYMRDTLSDEAFQRLFAVIRNESNYVFNIENFDESNNSEIIKELNSIFERSLLKRSLSISEFAAVVESEIEATLLSHKNLNKWLSKSTHPTKKVLCYTGDAIHFTLLDCEHIQLRFAETNEKVILKQNNTHLDLQIPFQFLPTLKAHVHRAFCSTKLLLNICSIIEELFIDFYDKRSFAELSPIISSELTKNREKPWGCFITNNTKDIYKAFIPSEFIHFVLPSFGHSYSILVYRQIIPQRIESFHSQPKTKIVGTFLNDKLQIIGTKVLEALLQNDKNGVKEALTELFQTNSFTIIIGFTIEGLENCKNVLKNYIFVECDDISLFAFK
uniref:Uncharacterized protein n=1 Tax=Panagrolaimus sp. PS1159 TaxID=55785 RepID=A0AC35FCI5_9BILA